MLFTNEKTKTDRKKCIFIKVLLYTNEKRSITSVLLNKGMKCWYAVPSLQVLDLTSKDS